MLPLLTPEFSHVLQLKSPSCPGINCVDSFGNTALHTAAYRSKKAVAVLLLQNGIDTTLKNAKGQLSTSHMTDLCFVQ